MSRALPKYNKRRVVLIGGAVAVALSGAVIAGSALAGTPSKSSGTSNARTFAASPGTITCPDVASQLPAVPASAKAEVDRNLTLLQTQITEANKRLVDTVGQGGPNFVNNAILGPLKDKRVSTIDRIAIAIGRTSTKPTGLDSLAACTLNASGTSTNTGSGTATGTASASAAPSTAATQQQSTGSTGSTNTSTSAVGTITCPDVASQLPAIPASAQAEVDRNLT
ncbi:hypothetical protein ACFV23_49420, partial [Streptomyces sp. NPDC059627]